MKERLRMRAAIGFVLEMAELYFEKRVSRSAAELAYFLILSFFPLLICANAMIGMMHLDLQTLLAHVGAVIPAEVQEIIGEYLGYIEKDGAGLLAAGLFMTLYSASAAFRCLMNMMAEISGGRRLTGFRQVGLSVLYSLFLLVTVYLSGMILLMGEWFFRLRFVILFFLVLALILAVYRLSAPRDGERHPLFAGALLSSGTLAAASGLFSRFIGMSARYSLVYGSLASVMILLVWLYLCGNILILGNVFNYVRYRHQKGEKKDERGSDPFHAS